jgi:predicted methyltransferase MtxX (methanogen marker protein 4)
MINPLGVNRRLERDKNGETLVELLNWRDSAIDDVLSGVVDELVKGSLQSVEELKRFKACVGLKLSCIKNYQMRCL